MSLRELTGGLWPLGWHTGRDSPNTRRLLVEHGGYEYDSDYYGDDLPFWTRVTSADGKVSPHLVVSYTLDTNDMRFATPQGFNTATHFYEYLRDSFDVLYAEGTETPRMLSIGMRCRLLGRLGRSSVEEPPQIQLVDLESEDREFPALAFQPGSPRFRTVVQRIDYDGPPLPFAYKRKLGSRGTSQRQRTTDTCALRSLEEAEQGMLPATAPR